jgi:hypothetical protein
MDANLCEGITGDYFRPLVAGQYQVAVEADGYEIAIKSVNVSQQAMLERRPILVNFQMHPLASNAGVDGQQMVVVPDEEAEEEPTKEFGEEEEPEGGFGQLSPEQVW